MYPLFAIDPTHPEELLPIGLVVVGVIVGAFILLRTIFSGSRRGAAPSLPTKAFQTVVVPICARTAEEILASDALPVACSLAGDRNGRVVVTYAIEVPRALAPDAPMPEDEERARAVLSRAGETGKSRGVRVETELRKGRKFLDETVRSAQENRADLVVLFSPPPQAADLAEPLFGMGDLDADGRPDTLSSVLLKRLPCEVVIVSNAPVATAPAASPAAAA